jgi:hypothetical protein
MKKMFKVLSPNKDDSVNVYLDVFPKDGKLQLREFDERDLRERNSGSNPSGSVRAAADSDPLPF